jgi:hypothetical protein
MNPLFSTYNQGENRVTATMLAVFERLSFGLVEQILQAILEEPETKLVSFRNQPPGPASVPDGRIAASFSYWLETKTVPDAVRPGQIRRHLQALDATQAETQRLIVITPDQEAPRALGRIGDERIAWSSFDNLVEAIREALNVEEDWLAEAGPLPTETERDLLREFVHFLNREKLVGRGQDQVLIVAARLAFPQYERYGLYWCQPNRSFRPSSHLGFYYDQAVQPLLPRIEDTIESIALSEEAIRAHQGLDEAQRERLLGTVADLAGKGSAHVDDLNKVLFLSMPDDPETIRLAQPIANDLSTDDGRTIAFTQGQRYVTLDAVKKEPKTTSELLALSGE